MIEGSALAHFLSDWGPFAKHDLSASEARPVGLSDLLALAEPDDEERWRTLRLDYADPRGAPWLRAEIARRFNGLSADHVVCCAGAQEALVCVAQALLGPHDHAVVVVPVYGPSERAVTSRCSATGVALSGQGWSLDLDRVADAIRPQTKAIFVNFPNSPTGATIDPNTMTRLIALCRLHGLWLVNDEVYSLTDTTNLSWPPAASLYERAVSVSAVSKSYGLPGVRVGLGRLPGPCHAVGRHAGEERPVQLHRRSEPGAGPHRPSCGSLFGRAVSCDFTQQPSPPPSASERASGRVRGGAVPQSGILFLALSQRGIAPGTLLSNSSRRPELWSCLGLSGARRSRRSRPTACGSASARRTCPTASRPLRHS